MIVIDPSKSRRDPRQNDHVNTEIDCAHCGLPVPVGLVNFGSDKQFCCHGCEGAYQLIHSSDLSSFYSMADFQLDRFSLQGRNLDPSRFSEFDTATFLGTFAQQISQDQWRIKLALDGIHCAACIWLLEKLPSMLSGVMNARVNWSRGTIEITWLESQVALSQVAHRLSQLGYTPHPIRESEKEKRFQQENRRHLSRLGIAGALAGNNMIISAALYFAMFDHMTAGMNNFLRIVSCLIGLVALLIPGRVFLQSAWSSIVSRTAHMDLPIALALSVGTLVGTINVFRGSGEIYFDSLSVLIFLLLIGRWLQFRQQARAADAVDMLYRMTPRKARKVLDGQFIESMVDLLTRGDVLEVRSGELIPVDGTVIEGDCDVDESILTGESAPVRKLQGDRVFAGTHNTSSTIRIETDSTGDSTRLSKIARLVEESGEHRPQIVQWANQIGGYFVIAVLALAVFTMSWWFNVSIETAVDRTMALLIVACPCALALATPLAIAVSLGRAAKSGMMIKSGDVLQALQTPGMIWLDKTGTLTKGDLRVEKWHGDLACLPWLRAIERNSIHPVAKSLVRFADMHAHEQTLGSNERVIVREQPGFGVEAVIDHQTFLIGNDQLMNRNQVCHSRQDQDFAKRVLSKGLSPCWIARNGKVIAIAAIGDAIRPDAFDAIEHLRLRGWQVGILSGDHQKVVDRVATRLGIQSDLAIGEVTPEGKLQAIKSGSDETVVMVGDGVNDSAALAAANVGLAVKGGAEASLAAAPVYLAQEGLLPILRLMKLTDSTNKIMRRNLFVSLTYNISFAALAFVGLINPLVAAILMPISSLTVVSLSLGAGRFDSPSDNLEVTP